MLAPLFLPSYEDEKACPKGEQRKDFAQAANARNERREARENEPDGEQEHPETACNSE